MQTLYTLEQLQGDRIVISARTEEEDLRIRTWAHERGLKWHEGSSYLDICYWAVYKENTCYSLPRGEFSDQLWYKSEGYTVITVPEFFQMEALAEKIESLTKPNENQ